MIGEVSAGLPHKNGSYIDKNVGIDQHFAFAKIVQSLLDTQAVFIFIVLYEMTE